MIVLYLNERYLMSILVLQSFRWGRELVALLSLSSWCLVVVVWLFLAAKGLSAFCHCGISLSYSLPFLINSKLISELVSSDASFILL